MSAQRVGRAALFSLLPAIFAMLIYVVIASITGGGLASVSPGETAIVGAISFFIGFIIRVSISSFLAARAKA